MSEHNKHQRRKQILNALGERLFRWMQNYCSTPDIAKCERRGARLGRILFRLDKKHRLRAISNILLVFPEKSAADAKKMARQMFEHFGIVTADFMRTPIRTDEEVRSSMKCQDPDAMRRAFEPGAGVLLITAHFGNWERFGHWSKLMGYPLTVVARDADDDSLQSRVDELRAKAGMQVLSRGNSARMLLSALRKNAMCGILPDQNADDAFIPFFGKPAGTVLGPAVLQLRTGAPILPMGCIRTGVGQYEAHFGELINANPEETPEMLMARVNQAIEKLILLAPEQYLWMHDRWKNARRQGLL